MTNWCSRESVITSYSIHYTKLYETEEISNLLKETMRKKYGERNLNEHFADTRDTLCYATNDNQEATYSLLNTDADIAIIVGGYNSSNTGHIVELCERNVITSYSIHYTKLYDHLQEHINVKLESLS